MKSKDIQVPSKGIQKAISHLDLFISNLEKQGICGDLIKADKSVRTNVTTFIVGI